MKQGTLYGSRLKKAYAKLSQGGGTVPIPEPDDPLDRLALAVFGTKNGDERAEQIVEQLQETMVDWNEMRVSRPAEISALLEKSDSNRLEDCHRLTQVLQSVFDRENRLSLDRLKHIGLREAKQYLEELEGVDEYAVASVLLWSLGGHAIPVDDRLLEALRSAELVHPDAERGAIQAFLERHVGAAEAKEFCLRMRKLEANRPEKAKRSKPPATKKKTKKRKKKTKKKAP